MESLFGCKFFVALLGLLSTVLANDTILLLHVEPETVKVGDNVVLRCEVTNLVMGQFIRWSKIADQVTYNVATNGQMESGFNQPGTRYSADYNIIEANKVEFRLYISSVRNEDGGTYKCSMGDIVSENDLLVFVPPSEISLTLTRNGTDRMVQDKDEIKFEDGSLISLRCEVSGSNPRPEIYIKLGEGIIEGVKQFPNNKIESVQGDAMGQVRSTWEVTAKATDFLISHENAADEMVSCEAKVRDDMSIKTGFTVKMEGRPPVFQCDATEQMARLNEKDVALQCTAKATPPVRSGHVYWFTKGSSKRTLEADKSDSNYRLYMETEDATGETTVMLRINRVKPQMFRNYTFYVFNDEGSAEHTIQLYQGASSQVTVNLNLSKERAQVGDTLTVTCHVTSRNDVISLVTWMKRVGDTEIEETEIGTNKFVNQAFGDTKRYKATLDYDKNKPEVIDFVLTITNVQPSDSGKIGCKIPTNSVEVFKDFVVFSPISDLVMTSRDLSGTHHMIHAEGQNVTFQEGERRKFTCQVNGSYPAPKVVITVGKKDITNLFVKEEKLLRKGDTLGLKALTYETTLSNDSLEISYEFSDKKLQCKATVPDSTLEPKSQSILVELNGFTPKFECDNSHVASLHEANVQIRCVVKADPAAKDFKVYWLEKGENTSSSLSQGKSDGHFKAIIEHGETSNEHIVSLKIDRVFSQHFREYVFEAANDLGRTQHTVTLKSVPPTTTTTTTELVPVTDKVALKANTQNKEQQSTSESYRVGGSLLLVAVSLFALL